MNLTLTFNIQQDDLLNSRIGSESIVEILGNSNIFAQLSAIRVNAKCIELSLLWNTHAVRLHTVTFIATHNVPYDWSAEGSMRTTSQVVLCQDWRSEFVTLPPPIISSDSAVSIKFHVKVSGGPAPLGIASIARDIMGTKIASDTAGFIRKTVASIDDEHNSERVPLHRMVLMQSAEYRRMIETGVDQTSEFMLTHTSSECAQRFIAFLYTGNACGSTLPFAETTPQVASTTTTTTKTTTTTTNTMTEKTDTVAQRRSVKRKLVDTDRDDHDPSSSSLSSGHNNLNVFMELFQMAERHDLPALMQQCGAVIVSEINCDTIASIQQFVRIHPDEKMDPVRSTIFNAVVQFARDHPNALLDAVNRLMPAPSCSSKRYCNHGNCQ